MTCIKPVYLFRQGIRVSCGKCPACLYIKSKEWQLRILHEALFFHNTSFLTLTYNDTYLPADLSVNKNHVQLFLKRLRYRLSGRKIKYFCVSEYGEKFGRPHYHLILLGVGYRDLSVIEQCWTFGFIKLGTVNKKSVKYCTNYLNKQHKYNYTGRTKPFKLCSQGLGKRYAIREQQYIRNNLSLRFNGRSVPLPRYYRRVLCINYNQYFLKFRNEDTDSYRFKNIEVFLKPDDLRHIWLASRANNGKLTVPHFLYFKYQYDSIFQTLSEITAKENRAPPRLQ